MDKTKMLECLIEHYTKGNKARFADMIGIKPQLLSNWLKRDTFDAEQIFANCKGVSAEWLLTGKGEMLKDTQNDNISLDTIGKNSDLVELCKALVQNYQQRDDVMNKLVSMVKGLE